MHFMLLDTVSQTLTHCIAKGTLFDKYEDIHASVLNEKLNLESFDIKTFRFFAQI